MTWGLGSVATLVWVLVFGVFLVGMLAAWTELVWEQAAAIVVGIVVLAVAVVALLTMRENRLPATPPPSVTVQLERGVCRV